MRLSVAVAVSCLIITSLSAAEQAAAAIRKQTSIAPQGLGPALHQLAKHHEFQILYRTELIGDRRTTGAVGELTLDEALTTLLNGSGLTFQYLDDKTVTILPMSTASAPNATSNAATSSKSEKSFWGRIRMAQAAQGNAAVSGSLPQRSAESAARQTQIEEIVVTAQKREERLIDTPQSVTVVSADELSKVGATQLRDWVNTVPGLTYTTSGGPGAANISLRGVTAGSDVSPTVGLYVDEVPYGGSTVFSGGAGFALDLALLDLERIEVLRGPQGTLYGAMSMGGLVKYVTKQPDTSRFSGEVLTGLSATEQGGANYDLAAAVNAPLMTDKVALRLSGFQSHDAGFIDNVTLGIEDVNRSDVYGGRLDLLVTPNDALGIRLTAFQQDIDRDGKGAADYLPSGAPVGDSLEQHVRVLEEPFDQTFRLLSGTLTYDFGGASLTSISSYQEADSEVVNDLSRIYVPLLAAFFGRTSYSAVGYVPVVDLNKFAQEIRLASPAGSTFEWLIGGFYSRESADVTFVVQPYDLAGLPATADISNSAQNSRYEEYAAFGDLTWRLTDRFDLTGGIRYSRSELSVSQQVSGILGGQPIAPSRSTDDVFNYLATARYHFSDRATAYLRYATGYRPGGPAFTTPNPATGQPVGPSTFDPDRLKSYEAGFKAQTANGGFAIDAAVYHIDWDDIQLTVFRNGFGGTINAPGGATVDGAELALTTRPVRGLTVSGAFAYQKPELSQANRDIGGAKDERLPNVPELTARLSTDYQLPIDAWAPTVGATVQYIDERTSGFSGLPTTYFYLPDYTTVDLRAGFTFGAVDARLYVRNLLDERGQISTLNVGGLRTSLTQPRTFGVSLTSSF